MQATTVLAGVLTLGHFAAAADASGGADPSTRAFVTIDARQGVTTAALDPVAWRALRDNDGTISVVDVPLPGRAPVDLTLERFRVTTPTTRFVVGAERRPLDFDPSRVVLMRGTVDDVAGSHVYLALSEHGSRGSIDLGEREQYTIASHRRDGSRLPAGQVGVYRAAPGGGWSLPVAMCGTADEHAPVGGLRRAPDPAAGSEPRVGIAQIELAVETDYEFFTLFGDLDEACAYVVEMYGAVSDIYRRDVDARIDLTFVRLWDDPKDLFNEPEPLGPFRAYWEKEETGVHRDVAQFWSGRRDLPWGGVAYIDGLCNTRSYSVAGYALGFFTDPVEPDVFNRDITVTAHEIGHNCGTGHTHGYDPPIDTCQDPETEPQRGTIMAYCGQTFTGGTANHDLRFHTRVQLVMEEYIFLDEDTTCIAADCNGNAIDDAIDIAEGTSDDANGNDVPDECEDCNDNGFLDDDDIAQGRSEDEDLNGIPDECEPDCNQNGRPDAMDIALGSSEDVYGDGVPDECQADCNDNGDADYNEINADMRLDLNRNARLDACEDCDDDGTTDLDAIDHANNLWLCSLEQSHIREYLARTGVQTRDSDDAGIMTGHDLLYVPDRRLLVTSATDNRVVELDLEGNLVGDLVEAGTGGLFLPTFMTLTPAGTLLVSSNGTDAVLEFDADTGAFIGAFVATGNGGLLRPWGLAYGPNGNLFVASENRRILEYDGATGAFVGALVSEQQAGNMLDPRGILFLPGGNLLVVSYGTNQVLEYDGTTGDFIRQFNQGGTENRLSLDQPWGIRLGPRGDVYVSRTHDEEGAHRGDGGVGSDQLHLTNARIYQFDATSGFFMRAYVLGLNSGVEHPTGFDFVPGDGDCNLNLVPDACDIDSGRSLDDNRNGIPDECEGCFADLDGSGAVDFGDLVAVLAAWKNKGGPEDLDNDGLVGFQDLILILSLWGPC